MTETLFAIGIRDDAGLHVAAEVNRRRSDGRIDIYYNMPGERLEKLVKNAFYFSSGTNADFKVKVKGRWNRHVSYHASGELHVKAFNIKMGSVQKEPLGPGFVGPEELYRQTFQPVRRPGESENLTLPLDAELLSLPVDEGDASRFAAVFEIPASALNSDDRYTVSVHLVGKGATAPELSGFSKQIAEHLFDDDLPAIHVALWAW
jgi:hypothetical protein